MTMINKKIMCLVLSLAFVVMSSQAQVGASFTNTNLPKTDSKISGFYNRVSNLLPWRFQPFSSGVSHTFYIKISKIFSYCIACGKIPFFEKESWTPYAILGTIDHVKKIIEEKDSLVTNLCGSGRQAAITLDSNYIRGGLTILEQLTSDKHDFGKIGEGGGYILKGLGSKLYRPFAGAWQYTVLVGTVVKDVFFSSSGDHYTYNKARNDFEQIFKTIGAAIDMIPIGVGGGTLYYRIMTGFKLLELTLQKSFKLDCDDQNENDIYSNDPTPVLCKVRYGLLAVAPVISGILWCSNPQLAMIGGNVKMTFL
jgi:hypothetical protein